MLQHVQNTKVGADYDAYSISAGSLEELINKEGQLKAQRKSLKHSGG